MIEPLALAISGSNLTGETAFSCCLRTAGGLHGAQSPSRERGDIAKIAAELCAAHGVSPADLLELRIDLGPGSYTGLRVAVTFARFLQHYGNLRVLACDSLALLASAGADSKFARLRPLLDARRGKFHCGTMLAPDMATDSPGPVLRHAVDPAAMPFAAVRESIRPGDLFVVPPSLAATHGEDLRAAGADLTIVARLQAEQLFSPRLPLKTCSPDELEPRYLMASYAD